MFGYISFLSWLIEISELNANIVDTGQRSHSVASDLGLHYLPMSILWDSKLKWVKLIYFVSSEQIIMKSVKLQYSSRNQFKCLLSYLYKTGTTHNVLIYPQVSYYRAATQYNRLLPHFAGFFSI